MYIVIHVHVYCKDTWVHEGHGVGNWSTSFKKFPLSSLQMIDGK